jgi:homoserine kinase type II
MPGRADFSERPSTGRLEHACQALAQLHSSWECEGGTGQACPAVSRRLDRLRQLQAAGRPKSPPTETALRAVAERGQRVLDEWLDLIVPWLQPWALRPFRSQPCLCDVWHDHVLFEGDRVTGIIDYGAVKVDHPAVDVARMLGSLIEDDEAAWRTGLAAYRAVRAFSAEEEALAHVLDRSGTVLGVANWLERIAAGRRTAPEQLAIARRLETLVRRVERWEIK